MPAMARCYLGLGLSASVLGTRSEIELGIVGSALSLPGFPGSDLELLISRSDTQPAGQISIVQAAPSTLLATASLPGAV